MGDIKLSLYHLRLSIPYLALRVLGAYILILIASYTVLALMSMLAELVVSTSWVLLASSLLQLIVLLKFVLDWATVVYYIRDHQLVQFRGIVELDEFTWELRSLKTVKLHQNWLGHWFNFGDLNITFSSSGYREDITLIGLARVRQTEHIFREYLAEATDKRQAKDEEVPAVQSQL